jgi:hypothetical protein
MKSGRFREFLTPRKSRVPLAGYGWGWLILWALIESSIFKALLSYFVAPIINLLLCIVIPTISVFIYFLIRKKLIERKNKKPIFDIWPYSLSAGILAYLISLVFLFSIVFISSAGPLLETIQGAAAKGNIGDVKGLLKRGADVNAKDKAGMTPLLYAAINGYKDMAELLIAQGANVSVKGIGDQTPLHLSIGIGRTDIAELLIAKGADVNAKNKDGLTPLHYAAVFGHKDMVELLIIKGADINAKTANDWTVLGIAVEKGHMDVAELLKKHGAKY